ncbi:MAG: FkbM family methyltransferase [Lachnospiraceae bacterium]|nr:FkbM family methyltransferase [Lachnospiraceae bacterium]
MKKIVLFGTGRYGEYFIEKNKDLLWENFLFCDNNPKKQGEKIFGLQVLSFDELKDLYIKGEVSRIIITMARTDEVLVQCIQNGIQSGSIYYYEVSTNEIKVATEIHSYTIHSQDGEEVFLRELFWDKKDGFYVDVGAHHPFRFSNTQWAYENGWRGINIEPDIANFELFREFREEDININCGISDVETQLEYYIFKESALNTFCAEEVKNKEDIMNIRKIPVRRLDTIFREHGITNIDYMDIDVEGMEMNVLNSINWDDVLIGCILVEQRGMTLVDVLSSEVCKYLKEKGYVPTNKYHRTVIYEKT